MHTFKKIWFTLKKEESYITLSPKRILFEVKYNENHFQENYVVKWISRKKICTYIFCNGKDFLVCFQSIVCYMSPSHFSLIVYSYPPQNQTSYYQYPYDIYNKEKKSTIFIILHFH